MTILAICISFSIPLISVLVTILRIISKRKVNNIEHGHNNMLFADGEIAKIIDRSSALSRKNTTIRDPSIETFFDVLIDGESISGGKTVNG